MIDVVSAGETTIFQLNQKKLEERNARKLTQLNEKYPWKFDASSSDEFGSEENVVTNGELLFLSRPNTEVRDTDEEYEFLYKNSLCHLNEKLLLEENY